MKENIKQPEIDISLHQGIEWGTLNLTEKFGQDKASTINQSMRENYLKLKPSIPQMKTKFAQQLLMYAIRSFLLYKEIANEKEQDDAFNIVIDYGKAVLDKELIEGFSPITRAMMKNRFLFPKITRLIREKMNRSNDPNGWQYDFFKPEKGHLLDFNVTRCGMLKFLTDQGVPELTNVICRLDFHMAENFLPKCAKLVRTQTIAEGAECCDFRYLKK